jgi:Glycosyltransferase family 87
VDGAWTPRAERGRRLDFSLRALAADPHAPLALAAALLLVGEWQRLDRTALGPLLEAIVVAVALAAAWPRRDSLRLAPLLAVGVAFQAAWIAIHLGLHVRGDPDPRLVYTAEGNAVRHGAYPPSPYPPAAVGLFALETWLGGGAARTANAFLMVPFQAAAIGAIWFLRNRWSAWAAAFLALWPSNLFFWEFRFDLVPAAAIAVGISLAWRDRWHAAGWALGIGALAKWTPGLTALALAAWLLASRRVRAARRYSLGFAIPLVLVNVPLFLLDPHDAGSPYRGQSVRGITGESLPYLALRVLDLAHAGRRYSGDASVPGWSKSAAVVVQALVVVALLALAARARRPAAALALAAIVPAAFLLTNRIFSPQFFVVILVGIAIAAALAARSSRELLIIVGAAGAAAVANATLYPRLYAANDWVWVSAAALLPASAAVARVARAAER